MLLTTQREFNNLDMRLRSEIELTDQLSREKHDAEVAAEGRHKELKVCVQADAHVRRSYASLGYPNELGRRYREFKDIGNPECADAHDKSKTMTGEVTSLKINLYMDRMSY